MNCEKCGHEMLVTRIGQFATDYECPVCHHRQSIGALLAERDQTVEYFVSVKDGTPIYLYKHNGPPPPDKKAGLSYWALSADATGDYPPVLIHVWYEGALPSDEGRDRINAAIRDYVGGLLDEGE